MSRRGENHTERLAGRANQRRLLALGLGLAYYLVLVNCYASVIAPAYESTGLTYRSLPPWCWAMSLLVALLPLTWLPIAFRRPSDYAVWILYVSVVAPCAFVPLLLSSRTPQNGLILPAAASVAFGILELFRRGRPFKLPRIKGSGSALALGLPAVMIGLTLLCLALSSFAIHLSLGDIYVRRYLAREIVAAVPLARYATPILAGACIPAAVAVGVVSRRWTLLVLVSLSVVVLFSFQGAKSVALAPVVLLLVAALALADCRATGLWLLAAAISITLAGRFEPSLFGSRLISAYLIRRELIVPAQLTTYYWEFFSVHPYVLMTDSVMRHVITPRYALSTPFLIGSEFFGSSVMSANANIWAAGFAHFGYAGMVSTSVGAGLILRIADSLGRRDRFVFASVATSSIGLVWTNSALHTSMLSNGVVLLLLALYLYEPSHRGPNEKRPGLRRNLRGTHLHAAPEGSGP